MSVELPEGWEAWLAYFSASLPRPVEQVSAPDGTISFRGGSPGEVIVHLTPHLITVSVYSVQPTASPQPLVVARPVGYVRWRRLLPENAQAVVESLVAAARAARQATFRTCTFCERTWPPEFMFDEQSCATCASRDNGTIH